MADLPLTKGWDPADFSALAEETAIVDRIGLDGQHESRRWEYAMALRAMEDLAVRGFPADVGGAGSPFHLMLADARFDLGPADIIDPRRHLTLSQHLVQYQRTYSGVTCISVLEHVDDLESFLYHLCCLVCPGGILFLTLDACDDFTDDWPVDRYHFHWERKRIFNNYGRRMGVAEPILQRDFEHLGGVDWTFHLPIHHHVPEADWGYSPFAMTFRKRR